MKTRRLTCPYLLTREHSYKTLNMYNVNVVKPAKKPKQ